jgi:hypothetical protein
MHAFRIIQAFLRAECSWMHAKRQSCLARMTQAVQVSGLGVVKMAKALQTKAGLRHRIKSSDRLLSNPHLHNERLLVFRALAHRIVGKHRHIGIIVDWSELREDGSMQLLRAAAMVKGRAFTVYEEVHPQQKLGAPDVHRAFVEKLKSVLPEGCQPVVITDAGFRATWFKMLDEQGWAWIGRIRNRDMVRKPSDSAWSGCKSLYVKANGRPSSLGEFLYTRRNAIPCRLVLMRSRPKGRHALTKFGKRSRSKQSQSCRAAQSEPWLLAVSPKIEKMNAREVIRLYTGRMQIEQTFRDLKNARWGMGLRTCQTRDAQRLNVLCLIGALLTYAMWLIGLAMFRAGHQVQYGSRAKAATTLSVLSLAAYWLGQRRPPPITCSQLIEALAELTSMVATYKI